LGKIFDKKVFGERLFELMRDNNDTTYSLGEFLHLSPSAISRYTSGEMAPKIPTIQAIATKYGVNPTWLMGAQDVDKYLDFTEIKCIKIPILGTIAAGNPILAQQHIEGYEYADESLKADFCLRVKGDSMVNARILDGDLIYIRQQPDVENGEIAAVIIDNEEATLKRVYKINGTVILRAENPNYQDKILSKKDMKNVRILGKAVLFKSEVR